MMRRVLPFAFATFAAATASMPVHAAPTTTSPFDPASESNESSDATSDATSPVETTGDPAEAEAPAEETTTPPPSAEPRIESTSGWEDELVLRDGGFVRGRISELTPKERVVIVPASGEARVVPWSEIAEIRRASASPPQAAIPVKVEVEMVPTARLDIEISNPRRPVTLFQVVDRGIAMGTYGLAYEMRYRRVCGSPCGRQVVIDPEASYFISGNGVTDSREFGLPERGPITLDVRPGVRGLWITGIVLTIVGSISFGSSIAVFATGASKNTAEDRKDEFRLVGGMLAGIGAPMVAAGIPMWIFGRTKVTRRVRSSDR